MSQSKQQARKRVIALWMAAVVLISTSLVFGITLSPITTMENVAFKYTGHMSHSSAVAFTDDLVNLYKTGLLEFNQKQGDVLLERIYKGLCLERDVTALTEAIYGVNDLNAIIGEDKANVARAIALALYPKGAVGIDVAALNSAITAASGSTTPLNYTSESLVLAAQSALWNLIGGHQIDYAYMADKVFDQSGATIDIQYAYEYFRNLTGVGPTPMPTVNLTMSPIDGVVVGDTITLTVSYELTAVGIDPSEVALDLRSNLGTVDGVITDVGTAKQLKITLPVADYLNRLAGEDLKIQVKGQYGYADVFYLVSDSEMSDPSQSVLLLDYVQPKQVQVERTFTYVPNSSTRITTTTTVPEETTTTSTTTTTTTTTTTESQTTTTESTSVTEITEVTLPEGALDTDGTVILDEETPLGDLVLPQTGEKFMQLFAVLGFSLMSFGILMRLSRS